MIFCTLSPGYGCSFKLNSNCYTAIGKQDVQFHSHDVNLTHKALMIYPISTLTLNLNEQNIVGIHAGSI